MCAKEVAGTVDKPSMKPGEMRANLQMVFSGSPAKGDGQDAESEAAAVGKGSGS
jgi:hypothetical protein